MTRYDEYRGNICQYHKAPAKPFRKKTFTTARQDRLIYDRSNMKACILNSMSRLLALNLSAPGAGVKVPRNRTHLIPQAQALWTLHISKKPTNKSLAPEIELYYCSFYNMLCQLYCTILCYVITRNFICYDMLSYTTLCCVMSCYVIVCCILLYCVISRHNTTQRSIR